MSETNGTTKPLNGQFTMLVAVSAMLGTVSNWSTIVSDKTEERMIQLIDNRYDENRRGITDLDSRLSRLVEAEQNRNNDIESRLSKAEAVDQLLTSGLLELVDEKP